MLRSVSFLTSVLLCGVFQAMASQALPEDSDNLFSLSVEELLQVPVKIGSRGHSRQWHLSPVPVDVITASELQNTGFGDLNRILLHTLPYFSFKQLTIRDGSDHTRPFSLRGMSPDQVLVLVNGKRYHPGALTHLSSAMGKGANHVDLGFFPVSSIERIEILKDGAAAQYGSDAIAGIINIVLNKHAPDQLQLTSGATAQGDGNFYAINANKHFRFDNQGFIQANIATRQFNKTIRAGKDIRQQYFSGDSRNQDPMLSNIVNMESADPDRRDLTFNLNGEFNFDGSKLYGFANLNQRHSNAGGFFRRALDNRTLRSRYPDGFLPRIEATIDDYSLTLGFTDTSAQSWSFDISNTFGQNRFAYRVGNSVNVSMGEDSPSEFDAGALVFMQDTLNLDWSYDNHRQNPGKLSFGLEYRYARYQIESGEPASYIHGGVPVLDGPNAGDQTQAGAQVFPGFTPQNARDVEHSSAAGYLDYEQRFENQYLLQGALRYEYHQDFGSTFDFKLAGRRQLNPRWHLRASTSTGFRAPTLAQQHFTSTSISFIDDKLVDLGTFSVDAPVAKALGSQPLKPEQSKHYAMGIGYQSTENLLVQLDWFEIDIEDRIGLSGNISQNPDNFSPQIVDILKNYQVANARFFTNAIDTHTQGLDLSVRYSNLLNNGHNYRFEMNYHYNQTRLAGDIKTPGPLGNHPEVIFNRTENNRLTARVPNNNLAFTLFYQFDNVDITFKTIRFGSVHLVFDENRPQNDQQLSAKWLVDIDFKVFIGSDWDIAIGAHNLFDTMPDHNNTRVDDPFYGKDRIFQYSDGSPFGFNGSTWYLRTNLRF